MPYFFYLILSLYGIRTFILILSPSMNEGLKKKTRVVVETEGKEERRREMGVQSLFINAWIREAQEASRLVENLEIKIENNPQQALGDTARSNLFDLGIKLDRLESLLHNPPSKPILSGNLATGDAKETSATDIGYYQGRGIYILYEDVKSCQYEDVQILWSILVESNAPTLPSKQ
uniref:Uncharacterized protein n=1 Tax=Vitis vinifera TaxID=29760 RepID=F6HTT5_VITVI